MLQSPPNLHWFFSDWNQVRPGFHQEIHQHSSAFVLFPPATLCHLLDSSDARALSLVYPTKAWQLCIGTQAWLGTPAEIPARIIFRLLRYRRHIQSAQDNCLLSVSGKSLADWSCTIAVNPSAKRFSLLGAFPARRIHVICRKSAHAKWGDHLTKSL